MCMKLTVGKYILPLEVMDTPNRREMGMMGRKNLNGGMIFLFSDVKEQTFWMKNCLISLDIIMLIDNTVTVIHKNCPPCVGECDKYQGLANSVLELKSGMSDKLGIVLGSKLIIR